jgi:predicted pyridoxine 5'-phosphate oxidase superfamily flavin-nucleotide-binding protein
MMPSDSPFHEGERALQQRAGVRERVEQMGRRMIRDFMPDQHRELFQELPWVLVGSLDRSGRPWASALVGRPGFMHSPDPHTLEVQALVGHGDPLRDNLAVGAQLGFLGIQLSTRRRNRMNGTVVALAGHNVRVRVAQSFGNCPKYIHERDARFVAAPESFAQPRPVHHEGQTLSAAARTMVLSADTFFIATSAPVGPLFSDAAARGVDVSHRGGPAGFVRVEEVSGRTVLTVPDYPGNGIFNTLGNIAVDPRAGLLFVDFARGYLLSLTGAAEVSWDGPDLLAFPGAARVLRFSVEEGVRLEDALPLRWTPVDESDE